MKNHRIQSILLSIGTLVVTVGLFGPLEVYLSNADDIWFSLSDLFIIILFISGSLVLFFGLLVWLLKGKAKMWLGAIAFLFSLALIVQGTFLNIQLGALDGKSIDWNKYTGQGIINTVIWLVLLIVGIILFLHKEKLFSLIQRIGSGIILLIEMATIFVLLFTSGNIHQIKDTTSYLSTEGIYSVGQDNIIIFVLDSLDEAFFQKVIEESEEYNYLFKDFTHYNNAAAAAATTKAALPALITGKAYKGEISYKEYINQEFDSDGLYSLLRDKKYDSRIFTASGYVADGVSDRVLNQIETGYKVSNFPGLAMKYEQIILFKYLPNILKPFVWMYTGDLEEYKTGSEGEAYRFDDIKYYQELEEKDIQVKAGKAFRLIHLSGCHAPYIYDREVKRTDNSNVLEQTRGALKIVIDYIEKLKEHNVYDRATIIIMADHGETHKEFSQNNKAHGILLVKEAQQTADTMKSSSSPVSYWDLHEEIFTIINPKNDKSFEKTGDKERERLYYTYGTERGVVVWKEYKIQGNLNEEGVVEETGNIYRPNNQMIEYKFDQELIFGADSTAARYIESGVSASDSGDYSWTNSNNVVFRFPLETMPRKNLLVTIKCAGAYVAAGPQVIYLYANHMLCEKKIIKKAGEYQFVIPRMTIGEDKKLELQLVIPHAASPKKLFGAEKRADIRTLGIALSGLIIGETDNEAIETTIPNLLLGKEYRFVTEESTGNSYFLMGLSKAEKGYTWTSGHNIILESKLEKETNNDLDIKIVFSRVFNNQQYCRIRAGSTILFDETLSDDEKEIHFTFPNKCLINKDEVHLIMELPDACSPKELGTGEDKRELALALTKMIICEKNE